MIQRVLDLLATLPVPLVLAVVFTLPALEASTFLGLIVPGEIAILAGGVIASQDGIAIWPIVAVAVLGAVVGDQIGYFAGRHWGPRLMRHLPSRLRGSEDFEAALGLVQRRGAVAVLLGRWTASLRALVPSIAGMTGVRMRTFTTANVAGGATWATAVALGGYLAGRSLPLLEHGLTAVGLGLLALILVGASVWLHRRRRTRRTREVVDAG